MKKILSPSSKLGQVVWDIALFAVLIAVLALFLRHDGFVGQSGIQPFPY